MTDNDLLTQWHASLELDVATGRIAIDTSNTYRQGMRKLVEWKSKTCQADSFWHRNTIIQWVAYLQEDGKARKTIAIWLTGARTFLSWAVSQELLNSNPTTGIKIGSVVKRNLAVEALTSDEVFRLVSVPSLTQREKAMVWLMLYSGARGDNLQQANIEDLEIDETCCILKTSRKGESAKSEMVVVTNQAAVAVIREYISQCGRKSGALFVTEKTYNGEPRRISRPTFRADIKNAFRSAGIDENRVKTVQSLRQTAAMVSLVEMPSFSEVRRTLECRGLFAKD